MLKELEGVKRKSGKFAPLSFGYFLEQIQAAWPAPKRREREMCIRDRHNFNAGPSILPREVIENTAQAILDFNGSGLSLMEIRCV